MVNNEKGGEIVLLTNLLCESLADEAFHEVPLLFVIMEYP